MSDPIVAIDIKLPAGFYCCDILVSGARLVKGEPAKRLHVPQSRARQYAREGFDVSEIPMAKSRKEHAEKKTTEE